LHHTVFSDRVRAVRDHFGFSATKMAEFVGLKDRKSWERYEKGDGEPKSGHLTILYKNGVNIHWLLSGEGSMLLQDADTPVVSPDNALMKDVSEWVLRWERGNKNVEIKPENFWEMLTACYSRVLEHKEKNPSASSSELQAYLNDFLKVAFLMAR